MADHGRFRQFLRGGAPVAAITAAIGIGATGMLGGRIEAKTAPVAGEAAQVVGLAPEMGPAVVLAVALLVVPVAVLLPGLFDGHLT
jgi:hypothetical protein